MAKPTHSRYIQLTTDIRVRVSHQVFKDVEHLIMMGAKPGFWFPRRGEKVTLWLELRKIARKLPEHFTKKSLDMLHVEFARD